MLVGFTGAQCTGKTTLLKRCKDELMDWSFVDEVTRKVQRMGHAINEQGDDLTQLFILNEHLINHTRDTSDNSLMLDRCILDGYIYTKWLGHSGHVSGWLTEYACNLLALLADRLDVIFYTQPEDVPLVNDNVRSVNAKFRQDIVEMYEDLFACDYHWMDRVVRLTGSVDDRMETILNKIDEKTNIRQQ